MCAMPKKIITEKIANSPRVVIVVPYMDLAWQGVAVFCMEAAPQFQFAVCTIEDLFGLAQQGMDILCVVRSESREEESAGEVVARLGWFCGPVIFFSELEVMLLAGGELIVAELRPEIIARAVLWRLNIVIDEGFLEELTDSIWIPQEKYPDFAQQGESDQSLSSEAINVSEVDSSESLIKEKPSLLAEFLLAKRFAVGYSPGEGAVDFQESAAIQRPVGKSSLPLSSAKKVLHPSRTPVLSSRKAPAVATEKAKDGPPQKGELLKMNGDLERTVAVYSDRSAQKKRLGLLLNPEAPADLNRKTNSSKGFLHFLRIRRKGVGLPRKKMKTWRLVTIVFGFGAAGVMVAALASVGYAWKVRAEYADSLGKTSQALIAQDGQLLPLSSLIEVKKSAEKTKFWWGLVGRILPFFGQSSGDVDVLLSLGEKQAIAVDSLEKARKSSAILAHEIWRGGGGETSQLSKISQMNSEQAMRDVSQYGLELQKITSLGDEVAGFGARGGVERLQNLRKLLSSGQRFEAMIPDLAGVNRRRSYLLLVQNPLELRATGGYLGAVAVAVFDKGRLASVEVYDPYKLDDILKGKVTPPQEMVRQLGEKMWTVREANWSPDFPTSARQIEWFMQKQSGSRFDGTVGLNAYALKGVLKVLGGVSMDSGAAITESNLLEKLQIQNEVSSVDGVVEGDGFLVKLTREIFKKMQASSSDELNAVFQSVAVDAQMGQVTVSSADSAVERGFDLLGWTGKIISPSCPAQFGAAECVVDTFYSVDTNVGMNRANYYVRKRLEHNVLLSKDSAEHRVVVWYQNDAVSAEWPAGVYKNYIRVYVPDFSELQSVSVDGKTLSSSDVSVEYEFGKRKISFLLEVAPGDKHSVAILYSTKLRGTTPFVYSLFLQKQPGTEEFPVSMAVNVKKPLKAKTVAPAADVVENVVQYDLKMDGHQFMAVEVVE